MSGCWECGKPVDGAVCMGPHPEFRMRRALAHGHVEGLSRRLRVTPCKYCGRVMAPCGLTKHMTVHERASGEQAGINRAIRATLAAIRKLEAAA